MKISNSVSFAEGKSSDPNLLYERSTVSSILDCLVWEMSCEAFPIMHSVRCNSVNTFDPGTTISGSSSTPPSIRCEATLHVLA